MRRMPAEWEPQAGTWLTWPHDDDIWGPAWDDACAAFGALGAELAHAAFLWVGVRPGDDALAAEIVRALDAAGAPRERVALVPVDSDDVWARDHGPTVVFDGDTPLAIDWNFDAWGGKFPHARDQLVARHVAEHFGMAREQAGIVCEGGAIEVDGEGTVITTEHVLLNDNRNARLGRDAVETELRARLGVQAVLWLGRGLQGDDTDGHVDDMVRFVSPARALIVTPPDGHIDAPAMRDNAARLRAARDARGRAIELIELPVPQPVHWRSEMAPASYANFYVANDRVVVPVFDQPGDIDACDLIARCFPGRRVVGVDSRALVSQGGAIHCVTQQIPAAAIHPGAPLRM